MCYDLYSSCYMTTASHSYPHSGHNVCDSRSYVCFDFIPIHDLVFGKVTFANPKK